MKSFLQIVLAVVILSVAMASTGHAQENPLLDEIRRQAALEEESRKEAYRIQQEKYENEKALERALVIQSIVLWGLGIGSIIILCLGAAWFLRLRRRHRFVWTPKRLRQSTPLVHSDQDYSDDSASTTGAVSIDDPDSPGEHIREKGDREK